MTASSLASHLRTAVRIPLVLLVTGCAWFVLAVGKLFLLPSAQARRAWRRLVMRTWGKALVFVIGGRVHVETPVPDTPGLLVTNHLSYVDIFLLGALMPGRFVAKAEIRGWPVIGWVCRTADVLFVNRGSRRSAADVAAQMGRALDEGDTVILFPEGTSTHGNSVLPFKPPLLAPAAASGLPVHCGALRYSTPEDQLPAFRMICWWGDEPLFPHLPRMLGLRRFDVYVRFDDEELVGDDRKQLARKAYERVNVLFEPTVDFEPYSPEDPRPREVVEREKGQATPTSTTSDAQAPVAG